MSKLDASKILQTELAQNSTLFVDTALPKLIEAARQSFLLKAQQQTSNNEVVTLQTTYAWVSTIQMWREAIYSSKSEAIHTLFLELQNDALLSFALAHLGIWRPALQSLRSALEGVIRTLFYQEHPVEFAWWQNQQFRLSTTATLKDYFPKHPAICSVKAAAPGYPDFLTALADEYAQLSSAVHASKTCFFMTEDGDIQISTDEQKHYGPWHTRHRKCLENINYLLIAMNRDELTGTKNRQLRELLSLVIPRDKFLEIGKLGIKLR